MKYRFGLVLSGGGTRGALHAGVIQALQERGLIPDIISGCSAGALAGALFAADYTGRDILKFFKDHSLFSHPSFLSKNPGLFESAKYRKALEPFFKEDRFEALHIALHTYSTDLVKGELIEHRTGPLIDAIIASCAIPGIFTPLESGDRLLSDGGILNVFPVSPIRDQTEYILGVNITTPGDLDKNDIRNTRQVLERAFNLLLYAKCKHERKQCQWLIDPKEIGKFNMISRKYVKEMYQIGYDHAQFLLNEIESVLDR